jgi:hypothetical protein
VIVFETASGHRLRPVHLLLMLYRYVSGAYQLSDLSALNYVKGYLDGRGAWTPSSILTVSGHGIGEPEAWLSDRLPTVCIDAVSLRLLDTQMFQFLRAAGSGGVTEVFERFTEVVSTMPGLAALASDEGLMPYWVLQATKWSQAGRAHVRAFSVPPDDLPAQRAYDFIYINHSHPYLSGELLDRLRGHLRPAGWMATVVPTAGEAGRFAESEHVQRAKIRLNDSLARRGYPPLRAPVAAFSASCAVRRAESFAFDVPSPARAQLMGELLLFSMHGHVSDRIRLQAVSEALDDVSVANVPVRESMQLLLIEKEAS